MGRASTRVMSIGCGVLCMKGTRSIHERCVYTHGMRKRSGNITTDDDELLLYYYQLLLLIFFSGLFITTILVQKK